MDSPAPSRLRTAPLRARRASTVDTATRARPLYPLLIAALLPIVVFATVVGLLFDRENREAIEQQLRQAALSGVSALDQVLAGHIGVLETLAQSDALDTGDLRAFRAEAARVLRVRSEWLTVRLSDPVTGREVVNLAAAGAPETEAPDQPGLSRVVLTQKPDISGIVSPPGFEGVPFVLVRVPVIREGRVRYTLSGAVRAFLFGDILHRIGAPDGAVTAVLDRDLRVIARSGALDDFDLAVARMADDTVVAGIRDNAEGFFFARLLTGEDAYIGHARSALSEWTVLAGVPAVRVEGALLRSRRLMAAGGGAAFLFTLVLALLILDAARRRQRHATELAQKTLLLREVNHRVKNSLQIVSSLVSLQGAELADESSRQPLAEAARRITLVSRVHELIYRAQEADRIELDSYLRALCEELAASYAGTSNATLEVVGAVQGHLGTERALPLALILNELVTNAFKHAANDAATRIEVVLDEDADGGLTVTVRDDGPGLPADFTPQPSDSLGMRVVDAMARQLGGSLEVHQPARGAAFTVRVPA